MDGHRLLCAVDGSPRADWVARFGARLSRRLDLVPVLAHVARPPAGVALERRLAAIAARNGLDGAPPVLLEGAAGPELLSRSRDPGTALLVVGSRGHGSLRSLTTGSLAWRLAREATCPVVLAPRDAGEPPGPARTVCCALDDADDDARAGAIARTAAGLAGRMDARLVLVHVAAEAEDGAEAAPAAWERRLLRGRAVLDHAVELTGGRHPAGARVRTVRVGRGRPGEGLERIALEEGADLLVLGAPRHARPLAAALGSAFDDLRRARSLALVVCPPRYVAARGRADRSAGSRLFR